MMATSKWQLTLAPAALLAAMMAASTIDAKAAEPAAPVVSTASGPVQGTVRGHVARFLGIPYAAPPLGALRWRPPEPPAPWTQARQATAFGPTCAQITEFGVYAGPANANEDCLTLNVFAPAAKPGKPLPVLLWIHGGGLIDGESDDYDPAALVRGGDAGPTIVVTMNYRLGLFGFLAHPALDAEGHPFGNYGLLDQQAALRWVVANIARFGGDPHAITLGGQSAGSISVAAHMISPAARGLFQRAIMESGALLITTTLPVAEERGEKLAAAAGCPADTTAAACLRALPASEIVKLSGTAAAAGPYVSLMLLDGTIVPTQPGAAFAAGQFQPMPVILGSTRDEGGFLASINEYFNGPLTAEQYADRINAQYGATAARILATYPAAAYDNPTLAFMAVSTDPSACRHVRLASILAEKTKVYAYEFNDRQAPWYFPPLSFSPGAAYTADIQYLFDGWHGGPGGIAHQLSPAQRDLSHRLVTAWVRFMHDGKPGWPAFSAPGLTIFSATTPRSLLISAGDFNIEHKCEFWHKAVPNG
jgi:para-nitrobenzyl esterase